MDKYEVLGTLGEGSFGRVYKAKQIDNGSFVALKVISKRGRSAKELKGFQRECKIQRELHHPNIIQMIDSFETDKDIVVITEFANNELTALLREKGFLREDKVQKIVWDLVSALHYLHSNRVLHRDLKPQNILLDMHNRAKLCDFGFARNMSTGTHVLTSIKGTPLYMAPELIDEKPYDYNADLWSLGCILYELLMGMPPFYTSSILQLIRMIQHEPIQWPSFLSVDCISFLKGLLQKDPTRRLNWEEILAHPFIKGHIYINYKSSNLTSLSSNTCNDKNDPEQKVSVNDSEEVTKDLTSRSNRLDDVEPGVTDMSHQHVTYANKSSSPKIDYVKCDSQVFIEDNQHIEMEEWLAFLQHSMQEVINGELALLMHTNQLNVLVKLLRNPISNATVLTYVLKLLSIPFASVKIPKESILQIKKTYVEIKLVPNLLYAVKLIFRKYCGAGLSDSLSPVNTPTPESSVDSSELSSEDFKALESIFLLICYLVHQADDYFLLQFCDAVVVLGVYKLINSLLVLTPKQDNSHVCDILAILTHVLKRFPDNVTAVETILSAKSEKQINFVDLLRNSDPKLRQRSCYFIYFVAANSENIISVMWSSSLKETLEALMYDSIEAVRIAAELTVNELKTKDFYNSLDG